MLYLLAIFAASLYLGINVTSTVAAHAIFKYVANAGLSATLACHTAAVYRSRYCQEISRRGYRCRWLEGGDGPMLVCG